MLRPLMLTLAAFAVIVTGETANPPAQAQTAPAAMPDYIVNMNRQNSIVGTWRLTTQDGTTTAEYRSDGSFHGYVTMAGSSQSFPFFGYYSYRSLGGDRFELTTSMPMPRSKKPLTQTDRFSFQADGNIRSETSGAIAYRLQ